MARSSAPVLGLSRLWTHAENTVPAHALMSLRGLRYGGEWQPVWDFLTDRHGFPGPLGLDEAVDDVVGKLTERNSLVPAQVAPTVFELIGDAHQIGLRQDHVARLANVVTGDDGQRRRLLEHATNHLKWDTSEFHEWDQIFDRPRPPACPLPAGETRTGSGPASLHRSTKQLAEDGMDPSTHPRRPGLHVHRRQRRRVDACRRGLPIRHRRRRQGPHLCDRPAELAQLQLVLRLHDRSWTGGAGSTTRRSRQPRIRRRSEELVGLEDLLTVRTGLTTRFFVGEDSVEMEFDLTPGTHGDGKVDVDHGYLLAERHPTEPGKLVVTSQKTFSFVGLDDLPFSFLCEFGWIDMMRAMAQCRAPGGRQ